MQKTSILKFRESKWVKLEVLSPQNCHIWFHVKVAFVLFGEKKSFFTNFSDNHWIFYLNVRSCQLFCENGYKLPWEIVPNSLEKSTSVLEKEERRNPKGTICLPHGLESLRILAGTLLLLKMTYRPWQPNWKYSMWKS